MFHFIQNWLNRRIIQRSTITSLQWDAAFSSLPLLQGLTPDEKHTLQELAVLFLHHKVFEGAHDLEVTSDMKLIIALQACLPILKLGWGGYDRCVTVIVYPAWFAPLRIVRDDYGVVYLVQDNLSGEAWYRGPVVLSWMSCSSLSVMPLRR